MVRGCCFYLAGGRVLEGVVAPVLARPADLRCEEIAGERRDRGEVGLTRARRQRLLAQPSVERQSNDSGMAGLALSIIIDRMNCRGGGPISG